MIGTKRQIPILPALVYEETNLETDACLFSESSILKARLWRMYDGQVKAVEHCMDRLTRASSHSTDDETVRNLASHANDVRKWLHSEGQNIYSLGAYALGRLLPEDPDYALVERAIVAYDRVLEGLLDQKLPVGDYCEDVLSWVLNAPVGFRLRLKQLGLWPTETPQPAFAFTGHQIEEAIEHLTDREQALLRARFGLDGGPARTLEELERDFGVTRDRIRQIEAKALRRLRRTGPPPDGAS